MSFAWGDTQLKVTAALRKLGYMVTLVKADDSTAKAWAVDTTDKKSDTPQGPSRNTLQQKQVYISAAIRKIPEVGDFLIKDRIELVIADVETIKPAGVVLCYKATVR